MSFLDRRSVAYLVIILAGSLLFFPFLGRVALFDWDEINFAEIAREMIVTKDYLNVQINFQPFWEKPPLFIWMQVLSMKLFGVNEFAARFPNALGGIITLLVLYEMGRKIFSARLGLLWALVYAGSILPFIYFKSGIIDPWFNLFIFTGVFFATLFLIEEKSRNLKIFASGLFIGLAVLTKGPVALLIFGLAALAYLITVRFRVKIGLVHVLLFLAGLVITGGSWFAIQILNGHSDTVRDFIVYQVRLFSTKDAGHGGFPGYHIVVLLFGLFPASAFLFGGLKSSSEENTLQNTWRKICIILMLTVIILFEIVQTKIVHYSSLAYFPMTFLAVLSIHRVLKGEGKFSKLTRILLQSIYVVIVLAILAICLAGFYKDKLIGSGLIKDPFALGNLEAYVTWTGFEMVIAALLILAVELFFLLKKPVLKIIALFSLTMVFTFVTMFVLIGKIEGYSQHAAVSFFKTKRNVDCHIQPLGFKSYAHLFYSDKQPQANPSYTDKDWLLHGDIDKPAYFVFKVNKKHEYSGRYPYLHILYEQNGFIFAARYPEEENPNYD
jgi:4-amino-4-deoxy-L-arabinose transferase-like glycosyltransferase